MKFIRLVNCKTDMFKRHNNKIFVVVGKSASGDPVIEIMHSNNKIYKSRVRKEFYKTPRGLKDVSNVRRLK